MPRKEIDDFMKEVKKKKFVDPITNRLPSNEEQLTAVLVAYHQLGKIDWGNVQLYPIFGNNHGQSMYNLIDANDIIMPEHKLISAEDLASTRWDSCKPDLLFMDQEMKKIILVEAKIDGVFTYGNEPPNGQISRYLEFLQSLCFAQKALILLCPEFNHAWYGERIERACAHLGYPIPAFVMEWENVLDKFH